jgi:GNAT superfamily N-acetyltransferase
MHISRLHTSELSPALRQQILTLCAEAYDEDLSAYLDWIGPGLHLVLHDGDGLASHLMLVERQLQPQGCPLLRTGYVELVATSPTRQGRGYASALLRAAAEELERFELGALSPSDAAFYERLGWERWRGPLAVRTATGLEATPDEEVMIRRTQHSPELLDLSWPLSVEWRPGEVW